MKPGYSMLGLKRVEPVCQKINKMLNQSRNLVSWMRMKK